MNLNLRIAKLEDELDQEDDSPPLAQRLADALTEARSRRVQGLPAPEVIDADHPLAERLSQAVARAHALRAWAASSSRDPLKTPTNGAG
jgi:hypothetical protein